MNLPNQLTILRLLLSLGLLVVLSVEPFPFYRSLALLIFVLASLTDFLDGYLARKYSLITNFGKLMDPLADKILMCAGFVMLIPLGHISAWIVVLILSREFLVTGLRLIASAEGKVLAAENLGKYKTGFQIATIIFFLLYEASAEPLFSFLTPLFQHNLFKPESLGQVFIWVSLLLTLVSGFNYTWKNRSLLR